MDTKKQHILIIDDDETMRRLIGGKLAHAGYEVLYSGDAHQGREMARRFKPDLILLDIRMPDVDGFSIGRRLKSEPQTKDIPIVFLTNEDLSAEAEKNLKGLGAIDYIHKSIDPEEFLVRISKDIALSPQQKNEPVSDVPKKDVSDAIKYN